MIQPDIETLKHYTDYGIKLIGAYNGGELIAGGAKCAYKEALTSCFADIEALCVKEKATRKVGQKEQL
ncbi:hypothetical protein AGMMS49531_01580 [Endomicrobiia bacterium]|nr:hypothetical protein AGMMS49531_01580 [Endomicrobiia bacterium]